MEHWVFRRRLINTLTGFFISTYERQNGQYGYCSVPFAEKIGVRHRQTTARHADCLAVFLHDGYHLTDSCTKQINKMTARQTGRSAYYQTEIASQFHYQCQPSSSMQAGFSVNQTDCTIQTTCQDVLSEAWG